MVAWAGERIRSRALKTIRSTLLPFFAAAILLPLSGCGSDAAPEQVLDTALSRDSLLSPPIGRAQVEVASLGFEDAVLDSRILRIDRDTNRTVREALADSAPGAGSGDPADREDAGLAALIEGLASNGTGELDGVEVERVRGAIDVDRLLERIRPLAEDPAAEESGSIPGVGELDQLEETLTAADFELFAAEGDGALVRFDLILSLDDPENALPPSRIRFSLTAAGAAAGAAVAAAAAAGEGES